MCHRQIASVLFLSALVCFTAAGCNKEKPVAKPAPANDAIVIAWWDVKDSKEPKKKDFAEVLVSATVPAEKLCAPSAKNPGSYEWKYNDLKLVCADGTTLTAEGVNFGYWNMPDKYNQTESYPPNLEGNALKPQDSAKFLVEKKKVEAGSLKFQVRDQPPVPLPEEKRRQK
jgi:hypothetical protein